MVTEKLEAGKLYQVKHWEKGWIIAEYVKEVPAHSYKYHNIYMDTLTTSKELTRNVPLSHAWKKIWGGGSIFTVEDRRLETRLCTDEAIQEIAAMKAEIKRLDDETTAARKALREFCE